MNVLPILILTGLFLIPSLIMCINSFSSSTFSQNPGGEKLFTFVPSESGLETLDYVSFILKLFSNGHDFKFNVMDVLTKDQTKLQL